MRIVVFAHSLLSDWNNGSAHFLRGVVTELVSRGHDVRCYEPRDAWSVENLLKDQGAGPIEAVQRLYPGLDIIRYVLDTIDFDVALQGAHLVIVNQWNSPELVKAVGQRRLSNPLIRLFFHDTNHRAISAPEAIAKFDLSNYDGVLAGGEVIRHEYLKRGWTQYGWTWHEAADVRMHRRIGAATTTSAMLKRDLVWIGNWGNDEAASELHEFLLDPCYQLSLDADAYGVQYPESALRELDKAGIRYRGWLPGYQVSETFAQFSTTIHVPRGYYATSAPGMPPTRFFEALGCGIPLITAPWEDSEHMFTPGKDFLVADDGRAMIRHLRDVLSDIDMAEALSKHGRETVLAKHTCAHRVDQLMSIYSEAGGWRDENKAQ
jgi:spore maturation protein CgeB